MEDVRELIIRGAYRKIYCLLTAVSDSSRNLVSARAVYPLDILADHRVYVVILVNLKKELHEKQ